MFVKKGADYAVYINTSAEFDGSDSGALPEEAVSQGKIKKDAESESFWRCNYFVSSAGWGEFCNNLVDGM